MTYLSFFKTITEAPQYHSSWNIDDCMAFRFVDKLKL